MFTQHLPWSTCLVGEDEPSKHAPAFMELITVGETNPKETATQYYSMGI